MEKENSPLKNRINDGLELALICQQFKKLVTVGQSVGFDIKRLYVLGSGVSYSEENNGILLNKSIFDARSEATSKAVTSREISEKSLFENKEYIPQGNLVDQRFGNTPKAEYKILTKPSEIMEYLESRYNPQAISKIEDHLGYNLQFRKR